MKGSKILLFTRVRIRLDLRNKAQTFIDGALQAHWRRAGVLGQESTFEGQ